MKPFGLSAEPDVLQLPLSARDRVLILGTDGVWDVVTAEDAVAIVWAAVGAGRDAAEELVDAALALHKARGTSDNVTVRGGWGGVGWGGWRGVVHGVGKAHPPSTSPGARGCAARPFPVRGVGSGRMDEGFCVMLNS